MEYWDHGERFNNWDLAAAINYNGGIELEEIENVLVEHEGKRDQENWAWIIKVKRGFIFAEGGCDYTGWD